jgi:beta-lactamase regulating signal transducer with metallopeptidase domain
MTADVTAIVVKVTAALLLTLVAAALLRRRSAATRHWALACGLAGTLVLPLLAHVGPEWRLPGEGFPLASVNGPALETVTFRLLTTPDADRGLSPSTAVPSVRALTEVVHWVWAAGAFIALAAMGVGWIRVRQVAAGARPAPDAWTSHARTLARLYGLRRAVAWRETQSATLLATWGARRPEVLLPTHTSAWPDERIRTVAAHELAHVARGDWAIQMAAEVVRALLWWHPLAWIVVARLRLEAEKACDDRVLALGVGRTDYAGHLVDVAHALRARSGPIAALAVARPSTLQKRIHAMLNTRLRRQTPSAISRMAMTLVVALATLSIAGATMQPSARVSGLVVDPSGRHVAGVTLALVDVERPFRTEIASAEDGTFEFAGVPSGVYRLEVRHAGFSRITHTLSLDEGSFVQQQVALSLGTLQESVNVTGSSNVAAPSPQGRDTVSVPRPSPPSCTPSAGGGHIVPPLKIRDVRPVYPVGGVEAPMTITLEARIDFDGQVRDVRALTAAPPALTRAAADAVARWEFTPTLLNCERVEVQMTVNVTFTP